jgi:tetratricopeptide (TPR) repeat protein
MAFRNAVDISEGIAVDREASLTGRLQNNLGCVNVEIGNIEGALFEFEQSLKCQKENTSSNDADTQDADNLLSISITIFNIGATCARRKHYQTALKHTEAAHAMQEALLGTNSDMADNTLFYLNLLRKVVSSSQSPDRNTPKKVQARSPPESSPSRAITRKDEVLDIVSITHQFNAFFFAKMKSPHPLFSLSWTSILSLQRGVSNKL